jgi:hypothetical protein
LAVLKYYCGWDKTVAGGALIASHDTPPILDALICANVCTNLSYRTNLVNQMKM